MSLASLGFEATERGLVPDAVTRWAIRRLCQRRLDDLTDSLRQPTNPSIAALRQSLRRGPIALETHAANRQHYELPPKFFELVLGPRRKYSCCYFEGTHSTLEDAENAALKITCQRAQIASGQSILDLGCGWGALSLWMAEQYRSSRILAVSNSTSQTAYIENLAGARGLTNLQVMTADINDFCPGRMTFDRIVSVEMFEHLRNYQLLLQRIADWLKPGGALFVHVFCNRRHTYAFETSGPSNWMGRHFFTGGIMPAADLLRQFSDSLTVSEQFSWNGDHYRRTAEDWLANLDSRQREILSVLNSTFGTADARRLLNRWRMFFLAVAELFAFGDGNEWYVSHYLLRHALARKPLTSTISEQPGLPR